MRLIKSFRVAIRGLAQVWKEERSFQIQTAMAACVIVLMFIFPLTTNERVILLFAIVLVLVLEVLNTVVERFVDMVKPRLHSYVGAIKDMMAGAVFLASLFAAGIGLLILVPRILTFVIQ